MIVLRLLGVAVISLAMLPVMLLLGVVDGGTEWAEFVRRSIRSALLVSSQPVRPSGE